MDEPKSVAEMLEALENDHARLHKLGSAIQQAIEVSDKNAAVHGLAKLQVAQASHFWLEERLMEKVRFPDHKAHARKHETLATTLEAITQTLRLDRFSSVSLELDAFIEDSRAHVAELDGTFCCFLGNLLTPSSR